MQTMKKVQKFVGKLSRLFLKLVLMFCVKTFRAPVLQGCQVYGFLVEFGYFLKLLQIENTCFAVKNIMFNLICSSVMNQQLWV